MKTPTITIKRVNFDSESEAETLVGLLDSYASDLMGGGKSIDPKVLATLPKSLAGRSDALSFIAYDTDQNIAVGLLNAFEGFSTFAGRPLVNIHDVYVKPEWRGQKISQKLILALEQLSIERRYCKMTLEVLEKNMAAKNSYRKIGFSGYELDPEIGQAVFWQKDIG